MLEFKFYIVLTLCMFIPYTVPFIIILIIQVLTNIHNVYIQLCTMALGLTQPQTEISIRNILWGIKAVGAQTYHLHVPIILKSGSLNLLEHSGPVQACNGIALPFTYIFNLVLNSLYVRAVFLNDVTYKCFVRLLFLFAF
jgi:hypothetical protein